MTTSGIDENKKLCTYCKLILPGEFQYCPMCGEPVTEGTPPANAPPYEPPQEDENPLLLERLTGGLTGRRLLIIGIVVVLLLAVAAVAVVSLRPHSTPTPTSTATANTTTTTTSPSPTPTPTPTFVPTPTPSPSPTPTPTPTFVPSPSPSPSTIIIRRVL